MKRITYGLVALGMMMSLGSCSVVQPVTPIINPTSPYDGTYAEIQGLDTGVRANTAAIVGMTIVDPQQAQQVIAAARVMWGMVTLAETQITTDLAAEERLAGTLTATAITLQQAKDANATLIADSAALLAACNSVQVKVNVAAKAAKR